MRNIVLLDYGHGVNTKGKQSPDGRLREGVWSREVGKRLKKELEGIGFAVCEITPEDDDIKLQKRCERVNDIIKKNPKDNIILISIHVNAAPGDGWSSAGGASGWVHTNASSESVRLGQCYYDFVEKLNLKGNRSVPSERVWRANFAILRGSNCPALLTENLFQTNKQEVDFLLSEKGKETIINLHIATICKYFGVPCSIIVK